MIIVDIETTGVDPIKNSIISIGAVDYNNGEEFYIECHVPYDATIEKQALAINGWTIEQCWDTTKPTAIAAYKQFSAWATTNNRIPLLAGQQVGSFDAKFLQVMHDRCGLNKWPFGHRTVDLHSVAYAKLKKSLSLDGILIELGLQPEAKPHNALTGARLERDAFKLLLT
jgi:DNA polymerase-3 subunit epsilon